MNYNLIVLDFDGTLGDTRSLIVRTMQQTLAQLELPSRSDAQCAAMIGLPLQQTFTDLVPMSAAMGEACAATYERIFAQNNVPGSVAAFPQVKTTMEELHRRGALLTVASSRGHKSLSELLAQMQLDALVCYVLGADDVTHAKPHPQPVLQTLAEFGRRADETLVVGDTVFDIEMGRRAGAHTCGVTYGNGSREELTQGGAELVIDRFDELLEWVK